jgi:hypothetical protein
MIPAVSAGLVHGNQFCTALGRSFTSKSISVNGERFLCEAKIVVLQEYLPRRMSCLIGLRRLYL